MATVLVIDDERIICDMLRAILSNYRHEVFTAHGGQEGLALFKERKPHITLLDLVMPDTNGIEVLKHIRALDPHATVMILTGRETIAMEIQARELGVSDFLNKRFSLDVVMGAMNRALQQTPRPSAPAPPSKGAVTPSPQGGEGYAILVVDDDGLVLSMVADYLAPRGYRVRVAADGPSALTMVKQERPDGIVLDMYMPGMSGLEVLRQLRAMGYTGAVIVLTASQDEKMLQQTLDLGAVDVMSKPIDLERIELGIQVGCLLHAQDPSTIPAPFKPVQML